MMHGKKYILDMNVLMDTTDKSLCNFLVFEGIGGAADPLSSLEL